MSTESEQRLGLGDSSQNDIADDKNRNSIISGELKHTIDEIQPEEEDDESDDDFGSFDNAINECLPIEQEPMDEKLPDKDILRFNNDGDYNEKLDTVMNELFNIEINSNDDTLGMDTLLNERSREIYEQLSKTPHLKPNYWMKSRIRHNLLLKLGIPINLDELTTPSTSSSLTVPTTTSQRRKSINKEDINWEGFKIPEFSSLSITNEEKEQYLMKTDEILSKVESDNLSNSSKEYLEKANESQLSEKLLQLKENYETLIKLSSIWNHQFQESQTNFEIYEAVVQNFIGYSQKLERDALLRNLKNLKGNSKRRWR